VLLFYCWLDYYCALCHYAVETWIFLFGKSIFRSLLILMCHTANWDYLILHVDFLYSAFYLMANTKPCLKTNVFSRRHRMASKTHLIVNYNNYYKVTNIYHFPIWNKVSFVKWTQSLLFLKYWLLSSILLLISCMHKPCDFVRCFL
jgi:hypothetical protein